MQYRRRWEPSGWGTAADFGPPSTVKAPFTCTGPSKRAANAEPGPVAYSPVLVPDEKKPPMLLLEVPSTPTLPLLAPLMELAKTPMLAFETPSTPTLPLELPWQPTPLFDWPTTPAALPLVRPYTPAAWLGTARLCAAGSAIPRTPIRPGLALLVPELPRTPTPLVPVASPRTPYPPLLPDCPMTPMPDTSGPGPGSPPAVPTTVPTTPLPRSLMPQRPKPKNP